MSAGVSGMAGLEDAPDRGQESVVAEGADAQTGKMKCSYEDAGLLSKIFVTWLTPMLQLGYRRPLEAQDMPAVSQTFASKSLKNKLRGAWQARKEAAATSVTKWPLLWSYLDVFGRPFYLSGVLKLVGDMCGLGSPLVLKMIIQDLQNTGAVAAGKVPWLGIGLSFAIFALQMANTITVNNYFTITMQTGLKLRTASSALIYEKSLRLSGVARQKFSTGQVVNLMSTDANRVEMAASYLHYLWSGPFQVIVIIIFLFQLLSWAALVGFGFLLMSIPIQSRIATVLSRYRKETSATTDKRVRLMQEIIQGIRVIKFYAWEQSFLGKLFDLREKELARVRKSQTIRAITTVLTSMTSIFSCILTFLTYYWMGNSLSAEVVFPAVALFALLRTPLLLIPIVISMSVDGGVSVKRIQQFLLAEELDFAVETDESSEFGVVVENGHFIWESLPSSDNAKDPTATATATTMADATSKTDLLEKPEKPEGGPIQTMALTDIDFKIRKGTLAAVVGPVGSGKSSLLGALVGELKSLRGRVVYGGSVAYCPQQAWIQNATVRDNILFGNAYVEEKYEAVIAACALRADLQVLADGDMTEIGEKGVNLSGGQKQRISLARAAYSNVDVVLLDDPLSAVDAHVGKHLMEQCINGIMAGRTRLLVTHQLYLLPKFDYVIFMNAGRVTEQGTFDELMARELDFAKLMLAHGGVKSASSETVSTICSSPHRKREADRTTVTPVPPMDTVAKTNVNATEEKATKTADLPSAVKKNPQKMTGAEERVVGAVSWVVYRDYLAATGGLSFILACLASVVLWNVTRVGADYWLSIWTSSNPYFNVSPHVYVLVYMALGLLQGVFTTTTSLSFSWGGIRAARILHNKAANRVLIAPTSFFDANPTGRIISRFGKDQDVLDNLIPETLRAFVYTFALTMTVFLTMAIVDPFFAVPLFFILAVYYFIQGFYRRSSRELKRLESLSRSPLYAHFSETLTGLPTIRAFAQQDRFIASNLNLADTNNRAAFVQLAVQRWLGLRLESVGNLVILSAALCCYIFNISPALSGLVIGYALTVTGTMNWCIRQAVDAETQIISSERLGYYANKLPEEAPHTLPGDDSPEKQRWLSRGAIQLKGLSMRYRPDLPLVLEDITLSVRPGERIGIVGRTGAGKSSIMLALFRIIEPSSGSVIVDDVDISTLGLTRLRSQISIIPQDPVVFAGTIRWNLDPHSQYTEQELWSALERAHLKQAVMEMEHGLESPVQEGGENLSVGQRQLLCLARAILQKNFLLVLDEATANIDLATDALIQQSIRQDFEGCTILTIAHRINTVIDYDRIVVLERGRVVEFDTPMNLLSREDSLFASLVRETGEQNELLLRSIANTPTRTD